MPIEVIKLKTSPYYYLRGTYRGVYIFKSTKTRNRKTADEDRKATEDEIDKTGKIRKSYTFSHAVDVYLDGGGSDRYLIETYEEGRWKPGVMQQFEFTAIDRIDQIALDAAAKKAFPNVKPQTLNRHFYTPFIAVMNHAAKLKMCDKQDWMRPRVKRSDTKRKKWFSYEDAEKFYNHAPCHLKAIFVFCIYTGSRITEALELETKDINLESKWAVLNATKTEAFRGVPLHPRVVQELKEYWDYRLWQHQFVGPNKMVFMTQNGMEYSTHRQDDGTVQGGGYFKTAWAATLRRAGLEGFTPYSMRHTFNNWLILANVSDTLRESLMGHDSESTNAIYSDVPQDRLIETVGLLKDFTDFSRQ